MCQNWVGWGKDIKHYSSILSCLSIELIGESEEIRECRILLRSICVFCVGLFSLPVIADGRFSSKVYIPNSYQPDDTLLSFISEIDDLAEKKDLSKLLERVDTRFSISSDFGGIYRSEQSYEQNFIDIFSLDDSKLRHEFRGTGWAMLKTLLRESSFQKVDGRVCSPANVLPVKHNLPDEFWLSWGYVAGEDVFVRSAPNLQAVPIDSLSYEVVEPVEGVQGDRVKGLNGLGLWIKVKTPRGKQGYMYSTYFDDFLKAQICYKQVSGQWKIIGYVGGGD